MKKKSRKSAGSRKRKSVSKRASSNRRGEVRSRRPGRSRLVKLKFWVPEESKSDKVPGPEAQEFAAWLDAEPEVRHLEPLRPVAARSTVVWHLSRSCPYCLAVEAGGLSIERWPERCMCYVHDGGNVRCCDTAAACDYGHHYSCPYWDHTDEVPF